MQLKADERKLIAIEHIPYTEVDVILVFVPDRGIDRSGMDIVALAFQLLSSLSSLLFGHTELGSSASTTRLIEHVSTCSDHDQCARSESQETDPVQNVVVARSIINSPYWA